MKRTIFNVVIAISLQILVTPFAQAVIDRERSQTFYEEALQYYRSDSLLEAVIQLRNALQLDSKNLPARILLGEALLRDDQPNAAIKEFQLALSLGGDENLIFVPLAEAYLEVLKPEQVITNITTGDHDPLVDAELHFLQGRAYQILNNTKLADEAYVTATALNPTDVRPLLGRARIAISKRDRKTAEKFIQQAIGSDPDSFDLWMFKSLLHRDLGEYAEAIESFEQALRIRPTSGRALTARAALWLDVGNVDAALADLDKARDLQSDTLETIYLRTVLLHREGKLDEAREVLQEGAAEINAIADDVRTLLPKTKLMLGIVAFFQTNYEESVSHIQAFLKTSPNHLGAKRYLASSYAALKDWDSVIKVFRPSAITDAPSDPMSLSLLAEAYRAKGNHKQAENNYKTALELAPNAAGMGVRLAMNHFEAGKPEQALQELNWFAERFPKFLEVKIQLVRIHLRLGKQDEALAIARTLIADYPDNAKAQNTAGTVFLATGDTIAAREHIRIATSIDSTFILPRLNIARLELADGNLASAETEYRSILEDFPTNVISGVELARLLLSQKEFDEAKERIDLVLKHAPDSFQAHLLALQVLQGQRAPIEKIEASAVDLPNKFADEPLAEIVAGRIFAALGRKDDARVSFRHAVEKAEFDASMLVQAAEQQIGIFDNNGALWSLTKALQASPSHLHAGALKVGVLTTLKEFEKADELLNELFETHSDAAILFAARGDLRAATNRAGASLTNYQRAFELDPQQHSLQTLFKALVRANRLPSAEGLARSWLKDHSQDFTIRMMLGDAQLRAAQLQPARQVYEQLRNDGISNVVILNNLAEIYHRLDDERALETAKLALEQAPDVANVLDTYGWILSQRGDAKEGLSVLREAYSRSSTIPEIRYHIGLALMRLGKNEEALVEIEASLASERGFPDSDKARALVSELKR